MPDPAREPLLLGLAKEAFTTQIEKRVRPLARAYVERWLTCEFWLYRSVVRDHERELRAYKPVVLEVLRSTSPDEALEACRRTRPDLRDLWDRPEARGKLEQELREASAAVDAL